uniref:Pyrroline-5-carboxylate reductase n=1 Tax=Noccaea caerulescens TaxID=107243 RepID=A0A1J3JCU4_NOCCA
MADTTTTETPRSYLIFIRIMSKRRTWVCLFVAVYAILLSSSWNLLRSVLNWYKLQYTSSSSSDSSPPPSRLPAVYASVVLGAVFGAMSMVAATTIAVPAMMVIWISVVVLLAFFGKPRRVLVTEGRKITREVVGFVFKVLLKEGNVVATICAVLAYFLLIRKDFDSN